MLKINNLAFSYNKINVIKDVSFSLKKGSFITIIGPNGSGKTTLLNLLTGFLKPEKGEVSFKNKSLEKYTLQERAKFIAVVPQDVSVKFPFTCLEIVMMGRRPFKNHAQKISKNDLTIVKRAMEETETLQFAERQINELSGGERQRVILARALAQTPEILCLDEAFSAMDLFYSIKLLNLLKEKVEKEGLTVVSIMHDLNLADMYSDVILAMQQGALKEWGKTEKIMNTSFINSLFNINVKKIGSRGLVVLPEL